MTVSGNYAHPVYVNGYQCNNCTDVEYAKKHIDPAHPKSGPFDIHADTDPSRRHDLKPTRHDTSHVTFDGALSHLNGVTSDSTSTINTNSPGSRLDLSA